MAFGRHPEPEFREVTFQPHQAHLQEAITTAALKGSNQRKCVLAQRMIALAHTAGENQGKQTRFNYVRLPTTIHNYLRLPFSITEKSLGQWLTCDPCGSQ